LQHLAAPVEFVLLSELQIAGQVALRYFQQFPLDDVIFAAQHDQPLFALFASFALLLLPLTGLAALAAKVSTFLLHLQHFIFDDPHPMHVEPEVDDLALKQFAKLLLFLVLLFHTGVVSVPVLVFFACVALHQHLFFAIADLLVFVLSAPFHLVLVHQQVVFALQYFLHLPFVFLQPLLISLSILLFVYLLLQQLLL